MWSKWPDRMIERSIENLITMQFGDYTLQKSEILSYMMRNMLWVCYQYVVSFFFSITRIYGSGNQGWKMEWRHSLFHLLTHLQNFCISSPYLRLCWFESLTSWGKNAFTRGHSGFIEVEVETATWPFCASPFSEATSTLLHWLAWLILIQRSNWVTTTNGSWRNTQWAQKIICDASKPSGKSQWKIITTPV